MLRDAGNMSAPTALFVLDRVLARRRDRLMAVALGPGFTAALLPIDGLKSIWPGGLFLAFLVAQRLVELAIARRNTARLLAAGAGRSARGTTR